MMAWTGADMSATNDGLVGLMPLRLVHDSTSSKRMTTLWLINFVQILAPRYIARDNSSLCLNRTVSNLYLFVMHTHTHINLINTSALSFTALALNWRQQWLFYIVIINIESLLHYCNRMEIAEYFMKNKQSTNNYCLQMLFKLLSSIVHKSHAPT